MPPQGAPPATSDPMPTAPQSSLGPVLLGVGGILLLLVAGIFLYWFTFSATPQSIESQPKKIGIAYFRQGVSSMEGMKSELARLGYSNVSYVAKEVSASSPTALEDIAAVMRDMITNEGVDLIWSDHEHQAKVALEVTKELGREDIPVVFIIRFHDPVEYSLVQSFQSSGNNATGVAANLTESVQRTISFIRDINPDTKKIGIFGTGFQVPAVASRYFEEWKRQSPEFGLDIVEYTTNVPPPQAEAEFNRIAATIKPGDIDAIVHIPGHFYETQESAEYELTKKLGVIHAVPYEDMPGGGHFAYATNFEAAGEQSARIVDRIFRGTKPSDIPVEYGERVSLTLHMGRAKESNITFSDSMLFIAHEKRE